MADFSSEDYRRAVTEFTQLVADDFRRSAATEHEQRAALCRYFRRGAEADLSHPELIDILGISTPSVLDMAGYSIPAALRVMEILRDMKDDDLYGAIPGRL